MLILLRVDIACMLLLSELFYVHDSRQSVGGRVEGGVKPCNYKTILSVVLSGYTNEVGEAFRAQVPVRLVHLSYVAASGYVVADSVHKGWEASQVMC